MPLENTVFPLGINEIKSSPMTVLYSRMLSYEATITSHSSSVRTRKIGAEDCMGKKRVIEFGKERSLVPALLVELIISGDYVETQVGI
jgi:hypothetical protein